MTETRDDYLEDIEQSDIDGLRTALKLYRFFAYATGILLVVLVCVGMPMKYLQHDDRVVTWTGLPHGWLYMGLLITAYNVGRRVRWFWIRLLLIALAGTIPFLSFVAEASARKDVLAKLQLWESAVRGGSTGRPLHQP